MLNFWKKRFVDIDLKIKHVNLCQFKTIKNTNVTNQYFAISNAFLYKIDWICNKDTKQLDIIGYLRSNNE